MAKLRLLLDTSFFIVFILLPCYSTPSLSCPHYQKQALLHFKNSLTFSNGSNGGDFGVFSSWNSSSECCQWKRVTCSSNTTTPQVTALDLSFVIGSVNTDVLSPLFCLRSLQNLDISYNEMEGEIPGSGLANLTQLEVLDMRANRWISGSVPPQLFYLRKLTFLNLYGNSLRGDIPREIGNLTNLQELYLARNNFSGVIPPQLFCLKHLTVLSLYGNSLGGEMEIPREIGNLTNLRSLDLADNNFLGEIPPSLQKLDKLTSLYLENNKLSSEITWLFDLQNIYILCLGGNNLRWGNMSMVPKGSLSLRFLSLDSSNLEGQIPLWLSNLTDLQYLLLGSNKLKGSIPSRLFQSTNLAFLNLSLNALSGKLPNSIGEASSLVWLSIASNKFSGQVPECFPPLIEVLQLSNNEFSGSLPHNLTNLSHLVYLDLSSNILTGEVPEFFFRNNNLHFLNLRNNSLEGMIPDSLSNLENLQFLDLSNNKISGDIPENLGKLKLMINNPYSLRKNYIAKGLFPDLEVFWKNFKQSLHNISVYTFLDLSNNQLSGEIPSSLGALKSLKVLNVSHNRLSGRIPDTFGDLKDIESLDLSHNDLSGEIPQSIRKLMQLTVLDLSNNRLTGKIPNGPQMDTMDDPNSYANNSRLCGTQISVPCEKAEQPKKVKEDEEEKKTWFSWEMAGIGYPFGLLSTVLALYVTGYFILAPQRPLGQHVRFGYI